MPAFVESRGGARVRAVVAEDEAHLRDELCELLASLWPSLDVCARVGDGCAAVDACERLRPDVAFLDVQMPGLSGLDVARRIADACHVVFVTAFDDYAIDAFEQGALDYVLKPFDTERVATTVRRLQRRLHGVAEGASVPDADAAHRPHGAARPLRWITAAHGHELHLITAEQIRYFRAQQKCTVVATAEREAVISRPIKELVTLLDPDVFWQIHRGVIVNVAHVASVTRSLRGRLQVKLRDSSDVLPVSAPYAWRFRQM